MLWANLFIALLYTLMILCTLVYYQFWAKPEETLSWMRNDLILGRSKPHPTLLISIKEYVEFMLLLALYINVRPRNWPPFFSLELHED